MSELKEFDDTVHDEDEYETPDELYNRLCVTYEIYPQYDAAANAENTKCSMFGTESLHYDWPPLDTWCNPPHSKTEEFVLMAHTQWIKHNKNIMMIVPANAICAHFFDEILDNHAEYHRIPGRPRFLQNGKPTKYPSRNSYFVVIWRAREPTVV